MKKGLLRTSALTIVAVAGFSSLSHAATLLETMEQMMVASGAPSGAFTYDQVVSDTDTSFEITGVRMEPEPGEGVVTIDRLRIDAMDMSGMQTQAPPAFMDITAEGIHVPADAMDADAREMFPDGMTFDIGLDYTLDPTTQALDLNEFMFAMPDYGRIEVSADVAGMSMESIMGAMFAGPEALTGVMINGVSITLDDDGGLAALFEMIAADEGMDVDSFVNQAMLPQMQAMGAMFAADPIAAGVLDSISGFIGDYAAPGGPLVITANPPSPVSLAELAGLQDPTGIVSMLGLNASYDGSGSSAPAAPSGETTGEAPSEGGGLFGQGTRTDQAVTEEPATEEVAPAAPTGDGAFATLMAMAAASGMPDGALTYDQVLSDSPEGFILSGVHFEPEPGDYIDMEMLSVARIDMASIGAGSPPMFLQLAAQGVSLPTEEMDNDLQQILGDQPVNANFYIDYALDAATGDFAVNGITVEMVDLGTFTFTLQMSQVDPAALMGMAMMGPEAMASALLENAALSYTDQGFLRRVIAFAAAEEGMSEDQMMQGIFAQLEQVQPMFASDPLASSALDAFGEFLEDYQNPSGSLGIVLNPPAPVSIGEINAVQDPSQLPAMLGLVIGY
ncbi:MAG: hypothetical protein R3F55_18465 [Alphaproteobacteria bacterium]